MKSSKFLILIILLSVAVPSLSLADDGEPDAAHAKTKASDQRSSGARRSKRLSAKSPPQRKKLWAIALVICHQFCQYIVSKISSPLCPEARKNSTIEIIGISGSVPPITPSQASLGMALPKKNAPIRAWDWVFMRVLF